MTKRTLRRINWQEAAVALSARLPLKQLHPAVLSWIDDCPSRKKWVVGFSGGADSLALLLLLWAHWPRRRTRLQALHFNHRLRGRESKADEVFCRGVCDALGVEFISGSWRAAPQKPSEAEARAARHDFFQQHSRTLWLGHQQDDVAETMLMRLARGSGTGGLAAPRPVHTLSGGRVHLRPLLSLKKTEITTALKSLRLPWREDSSNSGAAYFRNRLRHTVVPAWIEASQRDALAGASRARELLEEDEVALEAWVVELRLFAKKGRMSLIPLAGKPRALVRRALHSWLSRQTRSGELSRQGFGALLDAVQRGKPTRQSLGSEGFAVIRDEVLSFVFDGKPRRKFHGSTN
ncbi:MAG: tRNA lysidine(34) synthetase TilS [Opitutaceae bacterium]